MARGSRRERTACFIIKLQSKNRNSIKCAETGDWKPAVHVARQRRLQPGQDLLTGGWNGPNPGAPENAG